MLLLTKKKQLLQHDFTDIIIRRVPHSACFNMQITIIKI